MPITGKVPKYFDYLNESGQYLTDHFSIRCETESLESDIARYRRRRSGENTYWVSAVYIRRLLEQIVDGFLRSSTYKYSKALGKRLHEGIGDGSVPRSLGYKMSALNELVRDGAHANDKPYTASDLEEALIQLDVVLRAILAYEGKRISGDEVASGTDDVLLAHSDSIVEKGSQAAQLTGNAELIEESRRANERAIAAECDVRAARSRVQEVAKQNEQLRIELADALQTIEEQKAELVRRKAAYARNMNDVGSVGRLFARPIAKLDAQADGFKSKQAESDAELAKAKRYKSEREAAASEAATKVSELEEHLDSILNEYDFISMLLDTRGKATGEQRRIVNFALDPIHKSQIIKVTGRAGTGKTLCLLAAIINYLEPKGQTTLTYGDQMKPRRALFICYNKDLASYIKGLLVRFPHLRRRIEVANYDQFLNQLVRTVPIKEYEYLARFATDVRFSPTVDSYGSLRYWNLMVDGKARKGVIREAILEVKAFYRNVGKQKYCGNAYLDENDDRNVGWLSDEIEWLEGRYRSVEDGEILYPSAERVGRGGSGRNPRKNSVERMHVIEVWKAFCWLLKKRQLYTFQQIVTILLGSSSLPTYDIIAIDEAQDLNILHIELFIRFMADGGRLLIAGDEGQRLYTRDFTWKEVDSRIRSTTLPLSVNMRNPPLIRHFANRLESDTPANSKVVPNAESVVQVRRESKESTIKYVEELAGREGETTVIVTTDIGAWESLLWNAGILTETSKDYSASGETIRMRNGGVRPGVYCFTQFKAKGLEFDNVIVDYSDEGDMRDERRERRIRYMQFTRARKTLLVRYEDEAPRLLKKYYSDYLDGTI